MVESGFEPYAAGICYPYGASDELTGEHKIKAGTT